MYMCILHTQTHTQNIQRVYMRQRRHKAHELTQRSSDTNLIRPCILKSMQTLCAETSNHVVTSSKKNLLNTGRIDKHSSNRLPLLTSTFPTASLSPPPPSLPLNHPSVPLSPRPSVRARGFRSLQAMSKIRPFSSAVGTSSETLKSSETLNPNPRPQTYTPNP